MLRIAVPNKGSLAEEASRMLRDAGYRQRSDNRDLSLTDEANGVQFFYLRPKDIATYVSEGQLHLGITGHDLTEESSASVNEVLELGFGQSQVDGDAASAVFVHLQAAPVGDAAALRARAGAGPWTIGCMCSTVQSPGVVVCP